MNRLTAATFNALPFLFLSRFSADFPRFDFDAPNGPSTITNQPLFGGRGPNYTESVKEESYT